MRTQLPKASENHNMTCQYSQCSILEDWGSFYLGANVHPLVQWVDQHGVCMALH